MSLLVHDTNRVTDSQVRVDPVLPIPDLEVLPTFRECSGF